MIIKKARLIEHVKNFRGFVFNEKPQYDMSIIYSMEVKNLHFKLIKNWLRVSEKEVCISML